MWVSDAFDEDRETRGPMAVGRTQLRRSAVRACVCFDGPKPPEHWPRKLRSSKPQLRRILPRRSCGENGSWKRSIGWSNLEMSYPHKQRRVRAYTGTDRGSCQHKGVVQIQAVTVSA